MRIINIVQDVLPIRMGVWLPGVYVSSALLKNHNLLTEIWFAGEDYGQNFYSAVPVHLSDTSIKYLDKLITERNLNVKEDIIVTNSPWSFQHKWGYHLATRGFKWVCMPHGNFQTWGLHHKWWKKLPYFHFVVKPMLKKAAFIRASGMPELKDMQMHMPQFRMMQIPNGVEMPENYNGEKENKDLKIFLFMARINFKKRILQLAEAWLDSALNNHPSFKLVIAGPDDGDLKKLLSLINGSNNIGYIGPIYGEDKEQWLRKSTFYVLPSLLEGFATSVLEAASRACIPVITEGCNFPEIFEAGYAIKTGTEKDEIKQSLLQCMQLSEDEITGLSSGVMKYIKNNYSMNIIASKIYDAYSVLLNGATLTTA